MHTTSYKLSWKLNPDDRTFQLVHTHVSVAELRVNTDQIPTKVAQTELEEKGRVKKPSWDQANEVGQKGREKRGFSKGQTGLRNL